MADIPRRDKDCYARFALLAQGEYASFFLTLADIYDSNGTTWEDIKQKWKRRWGSAIIGGIYAEWLISQESS